jgi:uncharacterized protein (DUF433 family)
MDWSGCQIVETVPGKVSGTPLIKGTRVPADAVLENYQSGESVEDIAYNFDLRPEDIQGILEFAASRHALTPRA